MFTQLKPILTLVVVVAGFSAAASANAGAIIHDRTTASGAIGPEVRTAIGAEIKTAAGQKGGVAGPEIRTIIDPNFYPGWVIGPDLAPAEH